VSDAGEQQDEEDLKNLEEQDEAEAIARARRRVRQQHRGPGLTRRWRWVAMIALTLVVIMSGGTLISQQIQQNSFQATIARNHAKNVQQQEAQAAAIEAKLCAIFEPIASLKAPPGSAADNPSRAFEQMLEVRLAQVAPALECKK
jgi:hypothetical protein